jgi:Tol biopolymer transport system component
VCERNAIAQGEPMRRRQGTRHHGHIALILVTIVALSGCTFIERTDVPAEGAPARGPGLSFLGDLSRDGRYETFSTEAPLVSSDTNDDVDVYVRDHATDTTERISVSVDGGDPNGSSPLSSISGDGRYVVFESDAFNIIPLEELPDASSVGQNLYLRDRVEHTTRFLDVTDDDTLPNGNFSYLDFSADGGTILFGSESTNIVTTPDASTVAVYTYEVATGATQRESVSSAEVPADDFSTAAGISSDGNRVVFSSVATNLVPGTTGILSRVYVRDRAAGTTSLVSIALDGSGDELAVARGEAISPNGRFVLFQAVSGLLTDDGLGPDPVALFVRDLATGSTARVQATSGAPHPRGLFGNGISDDGRFVLSTGAPGLSALDLRVYLWDRARGRLTIVGSTPAQIPLPGRGGVMSADASYVTFSTEDEALIGLHNGDRSGIFFRSTVVPTLSAAVPSTAARGSTVDVTLTGTYLFANPFVSFSGDGVAVTNVTVLDELHVRVTVQVAADAATGKRTGLLQNQGTGAGPRTGGLTVLVDALTVT